VKVNNQAHSLSRHFEIGEELRLVDWQNVLDALEFKNYRIFNQDIHSVATVQVETLELNRQEYLSQKLQSTEMQLMTETFFVCRFKKARTWCAMRLDGGANHLFCQTFVKQFTPWFCVSVVKHNSLLTSIMFAAPRP
jgi:hypothetical protein